MTLEVFLQGRWVTFYNVYAKNGEDHAPFLLGIDSFIATQKTQPCVVMGDFNLDANNNHLPASLDAGFRSLGKEAPFDTISFRTGGKNGSIKTSFIDDILLSLSIAEFATPLGFTWPRLFGHAAVGTILQLHYTQAAKLEVATPTKPSANVGPATFPPCDGSIPLRWYNWCRNLDLYFHNEGAPRGDHPVFRIREAYSTPKAFVELQQAFQNQTYDAAALILDSINKKSRRSLADWKLSFSAGPNVWTSVVAKWIKKPPLTLPYSLKVETHGQACSTVGLAEMHDAAYSFYNKLYNCGERFSLPEPQLIGADLIPDAFRLQNFTHVVEHIIARSSPRKATGLDGISVADFKALPHSALHTVTGIFHDILTTATFPEPWLNIKVTLIPKKGGELALKDLRPLSIAPVAYRIWAKTLLTLCSHASTNIHASSVGGVPKRQAMHAYLRVALSVEKLAAQKKSAVGLAIDTQKFFDVVPHALAARCLTEIGVPPIVIFAWLRYITSIRRYISIHNSIADRHILADRGIPQGDPISMLAAAAALGIWLKELERIPSNPSTEAWVFVDDRLLFEDAEDPHSSLQEKFNFTCSWDEAWSFNTRPKTISFSFGKHAPQILWPDGQPVTHQDHPVYLGIPIPLPSFSRAQFYEPIVQECCYILRNLVTAKSFLSITQRRYAVSAVVMKKLCYSSLIARLTTKQADKIRSLVMQAIFDKPLACHDAAVALVLQGHLLDYNFAAIYTSISSWHRYLSHVGPSVLLQHFQYFSSHAGKGPIRVLRDDIHTLSWRFDETQIAFLDECDMVVWDPSTTDIKTLQHNIREAYRTSLLRGLESASSSWVGTSQASPRFTSALHKSGQNTPTDLSLKDFLLMLTVRRIDFFSCRKGTLLDVHIACMNVLIPLISSLSVLTLLI